MAEFLFAVYVGGALHQALVNAMSKERHTAFFWVYSTVYWLPLMLEILIELRRRQREE